MYVPGRNATVYVMYTFLLDESRHTPAASSQHQSAGTHDESCTDFRWNVRNGLADDGGYKDGHDFPIMRKVTVKA